jgi:MazG family protein
MSSNINKLENLIETLRSDLGCPWDQKQTPQSMGSYLLEEAYELVEAIESGDQENILEELGDVLFQVLFLAHLYKEKGAFDLEKVAGENTLKMINRHPHVFGDAKLSTAEQVRKQWREIKQNEKQNLPDQSVLDSVPRKLPALMRAYRISERAAGCGFDWDDIDGVIEKVEEEWAEFKSEIKSRKNREQFRDSIAIELGDIFFTLVNVGRFFRIHPETALSSSTEKFERRFRKMELLLAENNETVESVAREELDRLWEKVKVEKD